MSYTKLKEYERKKRKEQEQLVFTLADKITKARLWAKVLHLEKTSK